ncbi:extensin-like [Iris pallida]|uniref:Extensin-like n=1 Tax=Iris pallida TaxID=29817 RepID=A0AAX6EEQ9_IRIPA|nr:extensin-like [Iris pallida]
MVAVVHVWWLGHYSGFGFPVEMVALGDGGGLDGRVGGCGCVGKPGDVGFRESGSRSEGHRW